MSPFYLKFSQTSLFGARTLLNGCDHSDFTQLIGFHGLYKILPSQTPPSVPSQFRCNRYWFLAPARTFCFGDLTANETYVWFVIDQNIYQWVLIQARRTILLTRLSQWGSDGDNGERDDKEGFDEHHLVQSGSRVVAMCRLCQRNRQWGEKTGKRSLFYTSTTVPIKIQKYA